MSDSPSLSTVWSLCVLYFVEVIQLFVRFPVLIVWTKIHPFFTDFHFLSFLISIFRPCISSCSRIPPFSMTYFHVPVTKSNITNAVFFGLFVVSFHVLLSGSPSFCSMETATCFAFCFCANGKNCCFTEKIEYWANKLNCSCTTSLEASNKSAPNQLTLSAYIKWRR